MAYPYPSGGSYPGGQYPGEGPYPSSGASAYPGGQYPPYPQSAYPAAAPPPPYPGVAGVRSYYYIKSQMSGFVATVQGAKHAAIGSIVVSKQLPAGYDDSQLWYDDPPTGTVRSKFNDYCIDIEGESAVVKPHQPGSSTQLWERCGELMRRTTNQYIVLNVYEASRNCGARIVIGTKNGAEHQLFDFLPAPLVQSQPTKVRQVHQKVVYVSAPQPVPLSKKDQKLRRRQFYIISELHGKVLDIDGSNSAPGARVIMWPREGGTPAPNQLWYTDSGGVIRSALNDFALEASGSGDAPRVRMMPYSGAACQQWTLSDRRVLNHMTHACLDIVGASYSDGAELCSYAYKGSSNQHWRVESVMTVDAGAVAHAFGAGVAQALSGLANMTLAAATPPLRYNSSSAARFYIVSELHGKVLDIQGSSKAPGARVIMWPRKGGALASNQLWYTDSGGVVRSALNDFALEANGSGDAPRVRMMPYSGATCQQWTLSDRRVLNRVTHACLDIVGASYSDGAELCSYAYKGSSNQHWRVECV